MAAEVADGDAASFVVGPSRLAPGVGSVTAFRLSPVPGAVHRGLPSPSVTFLLTLGDGEFVIHDAGAPGSASATPIILGGLHTRPALVDQACEQIGVEVSVHPLAVRALFGVPARELDVTTFSGRDVLGASGELLREQMSERQPWAGVFDVLGTFLRGTALRTESPPAPRPELAEAWRVIVASGGRARVSAVAARVGLSERRLRTLFVDEVGIGPKTVARLARFSGARTAVARAVATGGPTALADVAAAAGYVDQAHLTAEFREFAGVPPGRWVAEEFRNLQADGHPLGGR
ncbi:transcriptional regulator, AraC family [Beutenbergia cavernae DSM 12333]|uniref:Transcriptional regulator, AraC family n=1 Tax=Beutenbergia cavernae (strain ATCC BAA-8 / DSM 12333 / CCUG 43141 / JCM 11478 / NBRC 16432 / NCIMB 13614 / HKI 0122) TaxID=471853 RepID=C5BY19_BEUC1|nr:helix-turn-helix domain-containing protein [Beutenbergia cavernae]ACQ78913.1 transcriptional regulator, AraC family [Beutenbergia cavernae DSM 12333]